MKKFTFRFFAIAAIVMIGSLAFAQTQFNATFNVDMTNADSFDPAVDEVWMSGSFAGWAEPGQDEAYKMAPAEAGSSVFTLTVAIDSGEVQYKYFRTIDGATGWSNGEWDGDPNRKVYLTKETTYDNVWANKPQDITFNVDMTNADPFDPATDAVFIGGSLANNWETPGSLSPYMMTPTEADENIYTITLLLTPGDYQFKYFRIINGEASWDNGEWDGDPNRDITVDTLAATVDDVWADINAGIFDRHATFTYSMYPNPVNDNLNLSNISGVNEIAIYDIAGKLVKRIDVQLANDITIGVSDLNTGIYLINVTNQKGIQTSKFIKN
ncbi:MAG: T9SS type A sorting domain-containing protein [Chlorobi bacterium]|nr:T9SS type A sorting domain-containing protein [Chlorobiota bacterium]